MSRTINFGVPCFAVLLVVGYSPALRAQKAGSQQSNPQAETRMHQGERGSRLEWLSKELNLTDDQQTKVKPILADEGKQMRAVRDDSSLSQEQKHAKMKQIHESADSQINGILTPDQQKKFAELQGQHKMHHEGNKPEEPKQP